jgi:hypothetical protein
MMFITGAQVHTENDTLYSSMRQAERARELDL